MKRHFKVMLLTVDGKEDFAYAYEHNPHAALELAIAERNGQEPWIGEPKLWRVFEADAHDANPDIEPLLAVHADGVKVPVQIVSSKPEQKGGVRPMLWEYTCETFDGFTELSKKLNKLGDEGWEVIAVLRQTETMPNVIIAKRQKEKAWSQPGIAAKDD
jgi:hypothetical protein